MCRHRRLLRLRSCWSFTRAKFKIHFPSTVSSSKISLKVSTDSGSADRLAARPAAARNCWSTLCEKLGIRPGETTEDGLFSLEFAECLGACDFAPAMLAGKELIGNLTREKIDEYVDRIRKFPPQRSEVGGLGWGRSSRRDTLLVDPS